MRPTKFVKTWWGQCRKFTKLRKCSCSNKIPQSLEKTFKGQNEKETLNESNTKLCSCCEDNFVAAYYCQECEDDDCESCYQAQK